MSLDEFEEEQADEKAAKIKRARELEDIRWLMSTDRGRRTLWRLLSECATFNEPAVFGASDMTYYNLGKQSVGRFLLSEIDQGGPEFYETMKRENHV